MDDLRQTPAQPQPSAESDDHPRKPVIPPVPEDADPSAWVENTYRKLP